MLDMALASEYQTPGFTIRFDQETEVVDSFLGRKVPDKAWRHLDSEGHGHAFFGEELPTLAWVKTGTEWIGDEYDATEIDIGEWQCVECGDVVEPQYNTSHEPLYVKGPARYTLVIGNAEYPIAGDDVGALVAIMRRCGVISV